ncbi:rRNA maturation RNase YbeY [candidate division GN15 bacterium]|nr:rRNA maturation RNase YbeY [candidate division GN15 bacterium]
MSADPARPGQNQRSLRLGADCGLPSSGQVSVGEGGADRVKLVVHKEVGTRVPITRLKGLFEMITDDEADPDWRSQVNLVFTTDDHLRDLNREFRAKNSATDVLSFNVDPPEETGGVFGEIYISVPFAQRQATDYGGTQTEEFLRLFCHGLLHLFGYDHQQATDARRMEQRQKRYLAALGERQR